MTTTFDNLDQQQHGAAWNITTAAAPGQIYELLSRVSEDVGAVGKNSRNEQQAYMFRGIDAFFNAVHPALVKHRVVILPEVLDRWCKIRDRLKDGRVVGVTVHTVLTVRFTFCAPDGSSLSAVMVGEGADTADKSHNKAMSAALKYVLMQTLMIPLEDMADADKTTPEMGTGPALIPAASKLAERTANAKLDVRRDVLSAAIGRLSAENKVKVRAFCAANEIPNVVAKMTPAQMSKVEGHLVLLPEGEDGPTSESVVDVEPGPAG